MNKFERVLSDEEAHNLFALNNDVFRADSDGNFYTQDGGYCVDTVDLFEVGRKLEQAVLAKLAEQEPVAWRITAKHFCGDFTKDKVTAQWWQDAEPESVTPLYAHPMPCVSPASDKPACVSESGGDDNRINVLSDGTLTDEGTIKHLSYLKHYQKWRRGEDKTMREMGLAPKQIGEALDWLIGVAENHIADAGKMVDSDHIADMRKMVLEGWQAARGLNP